MVDEIFKLLRRGRIEEASALIHSHPQAISPDIVEAVREIESLMKMNGEWKE